jgi:hypothetical protein
MKKLLVFFIITFLFAEFSMGQTVLGFRLGYNGNNLTSGIDSIQSKFTNGFHGGVFMRIGKRIYFAPEVLYTFSGANFSNEGSTSDSIWKEKIGIGSLDVPLLFGLNIIRSQMLKWRLELGPVASFTTNTKITNLNDAEGPITSGDVNSTQWRILAGTGIDLWFLTLDIRYQYALNSLIKNVQNYNFNTKNSMISVSLGFKLLGNQKNK